MLRLQPDYNADLTEEGFKANIKAEILWNLLLKAPVLLQFIFFHVKESYFKLPYFRTVYFMLALFLMTFPVSLFHDTVMIPQRLSSSVSTWLLPNVASWLLLAQTTMKPK